MNTRHIGILLGLFLMLATPALAQGGNAAWYAGAGLGRMDTRFEPFYTFVNGTPPEQFENKSNGLQLDLIVGRRHRMNDRFSLGYQGVLNLNRVEWSLSIPSEPAELRYSLPQAVIGSVVPEVRLTEVVSIFGDLGGGFGRIREIKTSPATSSYDYDKWKPALAVGGGIRVRVSHRADVFAQYRHTGYSSVEYDTFSPTGAQVEHVKDKPRARGFVIGITTNF